MVLQIEGRIQFQQAESKVNFPLSWCIQQPVPQKPEFPLLCLLSAQRLAKVCDAMWHLVMFKPSKRDGLGTICASGKTSSPSAGGKDCPRYPVPFL